MLLRCQTRLRSTRRAQLEIRSSAALSVLMSQIEAGAPISRGAKVMRRREFMKLLGGGASLVWPRVVGAQQAERMRRIGLLLVAG